MTNAKNTLTQIEWLQESILRLEAEYGVESENPFLQGLRTQLIGLERQAERAREREQFNLSVGYFPNREPEPEDLAAARLYEQRISELQSATESQETEQLASPESTKSRGE